MYFAVIGDIVSSKSLKERTKIQKKLENCLMMLNEKYEDVMIKKLSITLGDEFQALFSDGKYLLEIIHRIELEIYPVKLRFGIGIGNIEFDYGNLDSPYQSDGSVWWNARRAIEKVEAKKSKNKIEYISNIYIISNDEVFNNRINIILDMCYSIKSTWKEKQIELISYTIGKYGFKGDFIYKDVASYFGQSISTIYGKYKASKYSNYVNVMNVITMEIISEGEKAWV